jgi:acetylglutamate kinase
MAQKNFNIVWQNTLANKSKNKEDAFSISATNLVKNIIMRSSEVKNETIVVTLPTSIIQNHDLLTNFLENIYLMSECGAKIFIIHDYTDLVNDTMQLFGYEEKIIDNSKVADHKSAQLIEMVLSGYVNKLIVSKLCNLGCYAIGISGKDANLIQAEKGKRLHRVSTNKDVISTGFSSSKPITINPEILLHFEDSSIIPVISPIASDENGHTHLLDINLTASIIASALDSDHIIFPCDDYSSSKGLKTRDINVIKNVLNSVNCSQRSTLIEAASNVIENSAYIHLVNAKLPDSVLLSVFMG